MKLFICGLLLTSFLLSESIYSYTIQAADGSSIHLSDYSGRKMLIVNIATASPRANQLADLQQLQHRFGDSLVILAIPSNDFGSESKNDIEIQQYCQSAYGVSFLLASKSNVSGNDRHPLYQWLTRQNKNGALDSEVKGDFQKYIIDGSGELVGVFPGSVSPLSPEFLAVINP